MLPASTSESLLRTPFASETVNVVFSVVEFTSTTAIGLSFTGVIEISNTASFEAKPLSSFIVYLISASPLKFNSGVKTTVPAASTVYVPFPAITKGVPVLPVFAAFAGSIKSIVDGTTSPSSSVSLPPIVVNVTGLSSKAVPASPMATGKSFTAVTVISAVPVTGAAIPSDTVYVKSPGSGFATPS